jgi:hypothetical protein
MFSGVVGVMMQSKLGLWAATFMFLSAGSHLALAGSGAQLVQMATMVLT